MKRFMLVLLLVLLFFGISFAPLSIKSYEIAPDTISPGQEGIIRITLENTQPGGATTTGDSVEDVAIYFTPVEGMQFRTDSPLRIGNIEGGASTIVSVTFKVLPTAKGGILSPTFLVSQKDATYKQSFLVPIEVNNAPILTISLDKQTIRSTDKLNVTLTNSAGLASKLTIKLNESGKFSLINKDQIFVGDVVNSASASLDIDARNAKEGVNPLQFILSYQDELGKTKTEIKTISVTVKKESKDLVFTQEAPIITSKDNTLKLKIKNTGNLLKSFSISISDEKIKSKESNEIQLGDFASGEEKIVDIHVFADAEPGILDTTVTVKWVEGNFEKEEQAIIPITVSSDADVGIFLDSKPTPLLSGVEHTLSVLVSNIGSYGIENVELSLQESGILEILNAQKSQYIGGLESDDFSTVQYKIKMKNIQPGTYPLNIHVRYKDASGIWVDKDVISEVVVREYENSNGNGNILYILVIGVVLIIVYYYLRKRKLKQKIAK